jgi:predicted O-linked N-acetylglucosamine transferase (SPINDLY family)
MAGQSMQPTNNSLLRNRNEARASSDDLLSRAEALQNACDFEGAEKLYRRFLATHPKHLVALNNAAVVAKSLGRQSVALVRIAKALQHHPNSAEAWYNHANILQDAGRLEEAIVSYRRAIELKPHYASAHLNLGNVFDKQRRFDEAVASYQKALAYGGDDGDTHCNLGTCFKAQNRALEALTHYVCAATVEPDRAQFHYNVGLMHFEMQHYPEAMAAFRRVLELDPAHDGALSLLMFIAQSACDWDETERLRPLVRAATDKALAAGVACHEGALDSISRDVDPQRNLAVVTFPLTIPMPERLASCRRTGTDTSSGRIKIGYISADFRDHAVAHVISSVFGRHDRQRFSITAYSYGVDDKSPWRQRIQRDCDEFVDLFAVGDDDAARRIARDDIDILVDLTVWTRGNRPRICALRPAAVQVQYLGFPGSSGAPHYDYAIVDRTVVPPEHRPFWSESLVYLPNCYFIVDRDQPIASSGFHRSAFGLREDQFVFCCFNGSFKIEPLVFSAWMEILKQVPNSVLWLSSVGPGVPAKLTEQAKRRGIDPSRLVFAGRIGEKALHLERLGLADLVLDTLTYNGHTSTTDALWAGVPVVTVLGGHFASRVSASLLKAADLESLITRDVDGYIRLATQMANTPPLLASVRSRLAGARTRAVLFNTSRSVTNLEKAYERIWMNLLSGGKPADIVL